MREKDIERALVRRAKAAGGLALKLVSPGMAGAPDRLVLLPGGQARFVEVKAPGQTPRPLQRKRAAQLRALGFTVHTIDDIDKIDEVFQDGV